MSIIPLSVLDWEIFSYSKNVPSHGAENPHLRAKPSTVMAAPEPLSRFFYILPEILLSGKFYIHTEKAGNIAGFPLCINYCIFSSLWINFKSSPFVLRKVFFS